MSRDPVRLEGLIGRTVVDAWYNPDENADVITYDHGYVSTTWRHPVKGAQFFPVGFYDEGPGDE